MNKKEKSEARKYAKRMKQLRATLKRRQKQGLNTWKAQRKIDLLQQTRLEQENGPVPIKWKTYLEYIASATWNEKRKRILDKYKNTCTYCKGRAEQVHHLTYSKWGEEKDKDLVPICKQCHKEIHLLE